jgi:hypothetical protein
LPNFENTFLSKTDEHICALHGASSQKKSSKNIDPAFQLISDLKYWCEKSALEVRKEKK